MGQTKRYTFGEKAWGYITAMFKLSNNQYYHILHKKEVVTTCERVLIATTM